VTITPGTTVTQHRNELIVRQFDWTDWLQELAAAAEISTSTFAFTGADAALVIDQASLVTGNLKTQFRVSGGTPGVTYKVINTIVTNETPAQTGVEYFYVKIT
jgi:hypothetical protein